MGGSMQIGISHHEYIISLSYSDDYVCINLVFYTVWVFLVTALTDQIDTYYGYYYINGSIFSNILLQMRKYLSLKQLIQFDDARIS